MSVSAVVSHSWSAARRCPDAHKVTKECLNFLQIIKQGLRVKIKGWMMVMVVMESWFLNFRSSFSTKWVNKLFEWVELEKILKWVISTKNIP